MGKLKSIAEFGNIVERLFKKNAKNYQQDFTVELGGDIAKLTPIDTGKATANWTASVNSPDLKDKNRFDRSVSANPTKQAIQSDAYKSKFGDTLYLSNAVQGVDDEGKSTGSGYIIQLENGKSKQAPQGMVLINIARSKIISKRALAK